MSDMRKHPPTSSYPRQKLFGKMTPILIRIPNGWLEKLDRLVKQKQYANRNEAIRAFIKDGIMEELNEES